MERLRPAQKSGAKGPIKGDILLSNVQLVDEDGPIIWHGLQRPSDRILRQALMSPEKELKPDDKAENGVGHRSTQTDDQRRAVAMATDADDNGVGPSPQMYASDDVIVVDGLHQSIIIARPQGDVDSRVFGDIMDDDDGVKTKPKNPMLKGNPVMTAGFVESPPKRKRGLTRPGRASSLHVRSFDDGSNGLLPYLYFPDEGSYNKRLRRRLSSLGDKVTGLADGLLLVDELGDSADKSVVSAQSRVAPSGVEGGATPDAIVQSLELGLEPPIPMFAASLDRPSTPGSIQIVSDIDFASVSSKSPSKTPMKLVRTNSEVCGQPTFLRLDASSSSSSSSATERVTPDSIADIVVHPVQGHLQPADSSEYTDHLLSQLSGVLPAMSSSQVSSVLSALEPATVALPAQTPSQSSSTVRQKRNRSAAVGDDDVLIKLEAIGRSAAVSPGDTVVAPRKQTKKRLKYTPLECRAGSAAWYKCSGCGFVTLSGESAARHCARAHPGGTRFLRPKIKCIACSNMFISLQSMKTHLLAEHEALNAEIHDLLMATIEANKVWRVEAKLKNDKAALADLQEAAKEMRAEESIVGGPVPGAEAASAPSTVTSSDAALCRPDAGRATSLQIFQAAATAQSPDAFTACDQPACDDDRVTTTQTEATVEAADARTVVAATAPSSAPSPSKIDPFLTPEGLPKKLQDIKIEKDNALRCNIFGCPARFILSSNMDYHKHCHKGVKWKCPECEIVAVSWHSLSLHLWRQHAIDMELYSCDQCPFKTNSLSKLTNLHKKIHGDERPFLCDACGKGFKTTKQLRNHKSIHRAKEKSGGRRELDCAVCGRSFADVRMLRHHTDIVHRKIRPFLCSTCGHAAASRSSLRMHSRMHTGEKPYRCSDCDYTTGDHNSLRRHKMRHTGAKHYACPHCPYASIQSSTYKSHLKSKHPGLDEGLMFSCHLCPFRTVKKENFLAHASSHSAAIVETSLENEASSSSSSSSSSSTSSVGVQECAAKR